MLRKLPPPAVLAALVPLAWGCLEDIEPPPGSEAMCDVQADCDQAAGEVCDEGVCWGGPSADARFAAVITPPDSRDDLATTPIADLSIESDGTISGLEVDQARPLSGQVVLDCGIDTALPGGCEDDESIPARIEIERPSAIPGAPAFSRTITASGGHEPGEAAFTVSLPPQRPGEPPYRVTIRPITPETETRDDRALEAVAPPMHTTVPAGTDDADYIEWTVGAADEHATLSGRVLDAAGLGLPELRVYAMGWFSGGEKRERISTTTTTGGDGEFTLRIPHGVEGPVDVVAKPRSSDVAPTLRRRGVELPELGTLSGEPIELPDLVMPSHPSPTRYALPIEGKDPGGGTRSVEGAEVSLTTELASEDGIEATFTATDTTEEDGIAELELIPAGEENRRYTAEISPKAGAIHGGVQGVELAVGPGMEGSTNVLASVALPQRTLVDGQIVDAQGIVTDAAQVTARPSTDFVWSLADEERTSVRDLDFGSETTDSSGRFDLWLDPMIADRAALYDVEVVPPARALAPRWSVDGVDLGDSDAVVDLGTVNLPRAAHTRGVVTADGEPVADAEVRVYELDVRPEACAAKHAPDGDDCEPPARLRGLRHTGDDGSLWLVLPDPA